jgi:hypothetical protein
MCIDQRGNVIRSRFTVPATIAIFAPFLLAACGESGPTAPAPVALFDRSPTSGAPLALCPTDQTSSATALIGPDGGSVAVAGHRIDIPAGAVARPTRITLRAPAGDVLRVEITAGAAPHYTFLAPARVTISYDRCPRQHGLMRTADAWYLDPETGHPIEEMHATLDRRQRTVSFTTTHLSTYIVLY